MMTKVLIAIVGPTGIGKTALSIYLANHFNTEIISCDSRQFYKEMRIGTAAPTVQELSQAKHHFIHNKSIHDHFTVGDFETEALDVLEEVFQTNEVAIMVGGSGLFSDAVIKGLDQFPEVDPAIRSELNKKAQTEGLEVLAEQLNSLDPESYASIDTRNPQRVIRALEICIGTGKPFSSFKTNPAKKRSFNTIKIGLSADREVLYERIDQRVDQMVEDGLVAEVESLYQYKDLNALQTVGYKELFRHFDKGCELFESINEIKKNSRRYAKRQMTWNRKDSEIKWFDFMTPYDSIAKQIDKTIEQEFK